MDQPTIVVRIVAPHRAYGLYTADAGAVRLATIHYPTEPLPADVGVLSETATTDAQELDALLLGEVAHRRIA